MGKEAVTFISYFLSERSHYVDLGTTTSTTLATGPYGVVQGGKSSGELFLYFLNNLPTQLEVKIADDDKASSVGKEFVDDINIVAKAPTFEKLIIQVKYDFTKIQDFLINHKMCINASKSQLMFLLPPKDKDNLNLSLNGQIIKHQESIKILGVTLSADMRFDEHLWAGRKSMIQGINAKISLLKTIKPFISTHALAQV